MNLKGRTVRVQYQHPIRDTHVAILRPSSGPRFISRLQQKL